MKIRLTPIVEQLRRAGAKSVDGLLEFSKQATAPRLLPAYFVVPTRETASPNNLSGGRDQKVDVGFSVIIVLEGRQRRADLVAEDLAEAITFVTDALVGWTHPQASKPTDYAGGELLSADGTTVEWRVGFTARYHLRKAS